ncbi:MAG: AAA-like domain-containing protein [Candidatus Acidiferrales bacterium]
MELPVERKVFVSYVEEDGDVAQELARGLEAAGYSTWYYQRDCPSGASYLVEISKAIDRCDAFLLLISPHSCDGPDEITAEAVRAYKSRKKKIPVLYQMSHDEFEARQRTSDQIREWGQIMGASSGVAIGLAGASAVVPRIVAGLKAGGLGTDLEVLPGAFRASESFTSFPNPASAITHPSTTKTPVPPTTAFPAAIPSAPFPHAAAAAVSASPAGGGLHLAILYKRNAQPDEALTRWLEDQLNAQGHQVFVDRHTQKGTEWLLEVEKQIRASDAVIPLISAASASSEMMEWEVETAHGAADLQKGKPRLLPVRLAYSDALTEPLGGILNASPHLAWTEPQDNVRLVAELAASLRDPAPVLKEPEPAGGAVPLDSEYYIERPTDAEFRKAIDRRTCVVLVKGARQMGKTSLLARGLQQARAAGATVVTTDFQTLNTDDLSSIDKFYRALMKQMIKKLSLKIRLDEAWRAEDSANDNFAAFLETVLEGVPQSLVWGMDEVDRLFTSEFASEVFGLFRSWHNDRMLNPDGPWTRLSMVIVYATEAYLFIKDINQSPFNVGTKIELRDFGIEEVAELNRRYGMPLKSPAEIQRFFALVGGSPYLVRRGLQELKALAPSAGDAGSLEAFENVADQDEGPFGDHLRRILVTLAKNTALTEAVRQVLGAAGAKASISMDDFVRLRSAGVMTGASSNEVMPRCELYRKFLLRHLT